MSGRSAILGGGISGLSAAYYLIDNLASSRSVRVFEASDRIGGWLRSRVSHRGAIFEEGPRTIRPRGPAGKNTLNLIDSLGLTDKIMPIPFAHPAAKVRMIYTGNKLHRLPNSFSDMFKAIPPLDRSLASCLLTDLRAPRLAKDDESIYSFVERRLGRDVADYLISPMMCGICAGDAKQISVNFTMKSLFEYEQKYGSIVKGFLSSKWESFLNRSKKSNEINAMQSERKHSAHATRSEQEKVHPESTHRRAEKEKWSVWTLRGGLEQLPIALVDKVKSRGVAIDLNTRCEEITFPKSGEVRLKINGVIEEYSRVISSISAKNLAGLVQHQHPQLADELRAIPTVDVAVVNLEFPGNILEQEAFGFLVPPCENLPILGVIFDSCILPGNDSTVFTVMMGGAWFQSNFGNRPTEEHLLSIAVHHVKNILNIDAAPVAHNVAILRDCIPQYVIGHSQRIKRIENYLTEHNLSLLLCGSSYHGVGLNDVILSAKRTASAFYR